ncbi:MAG: T9SS type A sorting domain-containing protein [Chlorobi bacterium]|nr:T9SS type A sorting domain-containing protein [Chlorobiota bacterium]
MAVGLQSIVGTDNEGGVTSVNELGLHAPSDFTLFQNYPNPFNPSTKIQYTIAKSPLLGGDGRLARPLGGGGLVTLKAYDILGREVATLVNENKKPGYYEVQFNTSGLTSGIYFYTLRAEGFIQTKKMILLR